ncbi:MAG TPA: hypothetical protein VE817_09815 [Candidatus Acidoferrum sp.]|nr:hypothetical protein [Candidatus Acidoferrum sp.]
MTLEGILVGLVVIIVGLAWAFYGLRAFTILLPIWAFIVGFGAGASWIQELFGGGFLATTTSWVGGFFVGLVLALLSYFLYYAAVVLLGGALGYTLAAGFAVGIGLPNFLAIIVGLVAGAALGAAVLLLAMPAFLVVWLSAIGGATAVANGLLILLGRIDLKDIEGGLGQGLLRDPAIAVVTVIVVAAAGIYYQMREVTEATVAVERATYRA